MNDAIDFLTERIGSDRSKWRWGELNDHVFLHSFSETPLRFFFERDVEGNGNRRTINVGGVNMEPKYAWKNIFSANIRMVMSMDENEKDYYVIDTGLYY